jgi:hypothetical protein
MILFMTLAGGFNLWNFNLMKLSDLGMMFWMWTFFSWIISNYLSGYVAAKISKATKSGDGALHGLVIWASACVVGTLSVGVVTGTIFNGILIPISSSTMLLGAFIGDSIGLLAALIGGVNGAKSELRLFERLERRLAERKTIEPVFGN